MEMKKCTKCGEEKELTAEHWHRCSSKKDGFFPSCKECRNKANRKYIKENNEAIKERYHKNKNKYNKQKREYYQKNREKLIEYQMNYREEFPEKVKESKEKEYLNNRDRYLKYAKEYAENNTEKVKGYKNKYSKSKKGRIRSRLNKSIRRAREAKLPNTLTTEEYEDTLKYFNHSCAYCGCELNKDNHHMEHVAPISKGGGTTQENIIPSCESCNLSKQAKTLADWYRFSDDFSIERLTQIAKYLAQFTDWVVSGDE